MLSRPGYTRRSWLRRAAAFYALEITLSRAATNPPLAEDDLFLDEVQRANYLHFWEQSSPQTGLTRDRYTVRGNDRGGVSSIAATGFGLTALCIAEKRRDVPYTQVLDRVLTTLRVL